jgi:CWF19-like protein 2
MAEDRSDRGSKKEKSHRRRDDEDEKRRKKRRRHHRHEHAKDDREGGKETREKTLAEQFDEDMWEEKPSQTAPEPPVVAQRESWLTGENPESDLFTSLLGDIKQKKPIEKPKTEQPFGTSIRELNKSLHASAEVSGADFAEDADEDNKYVPPNYIIGDGGSSWRMMKLKNLRAAAKEQMRAVEDLAAERMGSLRAYDEAREEEMELETRKRDTRREEVMKVKVTGELYLQRMKKEEKKRRRDEEERYPVQRTSRITASEATTQTTLSDLNRLRAGVLRAEMTSSPDVEKLTQEYETAVKTFNAQPTAAEVVVLPQSHSTLLPHLSREQAKPEFEMTIEDMVREERAQKRLSTVDRIAKDKGFKDDLDYLDENAEKLAGTSKRREVDLKSMSIQDYRKQERIIESCPLCYKDDGRGPLAPVVSLATRTYLSLPTEPEITSQGAIIVPLRHARNLADCDDDEWEEIRVRPRDHPSPDK